LAQDETVVPLRVTVEEAEASHQLASPLMLAGLNPLAMGRSVLGLIGISVLPVLWLHGVKQLRLLAHGIADFALRLAQALHKRPVLFYQG
jgi:hypothetical protein